MNFLPVLCWSFIITDDTYHQCPEDINTDSVGDVQSIYHFPAEMNKHHQYNLEINILILFMLMLLQNRMAGIELSEKVSSDFLIDQRVHSIGKPVRANKAEL